MIGIFQRLINTCWVYFRWGLLLVAVGVAGVLYYLRHQLGDEIRCRVVEKIARHYRDLKVTARSAALVDDGIEVRGLSVLEPGAEGPRAELLFLDEVRLECTTDLRELATREPEVRRIVLRRPVLRMTHRPDGTWSVSRLLPLPQLSQRPAEIAIENGTIEIFDPLKTPASTQTLRDVNLTLTPQEIPDPTGATRSVRRLQGAFSADHVWRVEVEGQVEPDGRAWTIGGSIEGLDVSPELRDALPEPFSSKLAALGKLRGRATCSFRVTHDAASGAPDRFAFSAQLEGARVDDARLPHPLSDLRAKVHVTNEGLAVDDLFARSGQGTLRISARCAGFDLNSPMTLQGEIRQLELDRQLMDVLPPSLQAHWLKYLPAGEVNADIKLSYDGQTWKPDLAVECLNGSFTHYKFPYRLEHTQGTVRWKDDVLRINLVGYTPTQPVRVDAEVYRPLSGPWGWVEAKGDELELDEKLFSALSERPRAVVRSLEPRGTFNFHMRIGREGPDQPLRKHVVVGLSRCSVRYERFPYPLTNIRGILEMVDDRWTFRELEGTNDTGRVKCEGSMSSPEEGRELLLRFVGHDVPLEEELRDALRPNIQRVWNNLRPRGMVDLVAVVSFLPETERLSVTVRAEPKGDTAAIEPVYFPYRMEKVRGVLVYQDGRVTLEYFKAEHGAVKIVAAGECSFLADGRWNLRLKGVSVDRLRMDRELIQALPGRLKKAVLELSPSGPMNLSGMFELEGGTREGDPVRSRWDLALNFNQASIDCGIRLENLCGGMKLAGAYDGERFRSLGELSVDSVTYKDFQFTQVMGPLWIDDEYVLMGSWVGRRKEDGSPESAAVRKQQPRPMTGKLFGGTVYGDAWVALGPVPRYHLHAELSQGELGRCAQEVMAGQQQRVRGKIMAAVDLGGTGRSLNALSGNGNIRLRDADIYELPMMIAMLKLLSIREPDPSAFSKSDIDFVIRGTHIYFNPINFNGDAISLLGRGEMDFDSKVNMTFNAIVGRGDMNMPIVRELFAGASQQIIQIRVTGSLRNPEMQRVAFPGVNRALQRIQDDLQQGTAAQERGIPLRQ